MRFRHPAITGWNYNKKNLLYFLIIHLSNRANITLNCKVHHKCFWELLRWAVWHKAKGFSWLIVYRHQYRILCCSRCWFGSYILMQWTMAAKHMQKKKENKNNESRKKKIKICSNVGTAGAFFFPPLSPHPFIRIQLIQCNCLTAGGISTLSLAYSLVWASLKSGAVIICRCSSWQGSKKTNGSAGEGRAAQPNATECNVPLWCWFKLTL